MATTRAAPETGPWEAVDDEIFTEDGFLAAIAVGNTADGLESRARLIAKSPEMLQQLRALIAVIDCAPGTDDTWIVALEGQSRIAAALIAAATGEES